MATRRQNRISQRIRQEISRILLYELNDPRISGVVTVVRAETSADLQSARVYISVLGDEKEETLSLRAVEHARGHIQRVLGERLKLRRTPRLLFCVDESLKRGKRVSGIIDQLAKERGEREGNQG